MVAESGDEVELAAERFDIAGDGVNGGQFAAFDLRYPAWGDALAWASWAWVRPWRLRSSASRWPLWRAISALRRRSASSSPPTRSM
jgi:hypothetical protein